MTKLHFGKHRRQKLIHQAWGYWKDIGVHVLGFVPLGFLFCKYFSELRTKISPVVSTIVLGFLVSVTIEVLQGFLPTRDSGIADLITNSLGTVIGVIAVRDHTFQN